MALLAKMMPKENANSAQMGKKALFIVSSSSRDPLEKSGNVFLDEKSRF